MHPFMLLLGGAFVSYSQTLGHTLLAGVLAGVGSLLSVLAKRTKIPMLRALPKFAPAGSGLAISMSVVFLTLGVVAIGLSTEYFMNMALKIFVPVLGFGLLTFFDSNDLIGVAPMPPSVATLLCTLSLAGGAFGCAHVQPVTACVQEKLGPRASDILRQVAADLAAQNWNALLLQLGPEIGWDVLSCALDEIQFSDTDPVKVERAKQFKTMHAAKLKRAV